MKVTKILARFILGLFGLAILLYLVMLAINWRDQPPSAAYHRLEQAVTARPKVPAAENAVVYTLGFSAPVGEDPREVGARRLAWLDSFTAQTRLESDPLQEPLDLKSNGSPEMERLAKGCGDSDRKNCADGFELAADSWQPTATEMLALQRYRTLIALHDWSGELPPHLSAPLPAYSGVLHAQRLHLLSLGQLAGQGKVAEVRAGLSADIDYWRGAQLNAETLIAKMIAVAALRNHFFFSNLILRRVPADQVMGTMPPGWQRPFSDEERSMLLVMGGELLYTKGILDYTAGDFAFSDLGEYEPGITDRLLHFFVKPMFKVQDTANGFADLHLRLCEQFAVPMSQYPEAKRALEDYAVSHPHSFSIYNPTGDSILRADDGTTYLSYAYRAANPEGMRRAALLVAQLRARGITAAAAAGEVASAELRDPYSGAAFAWDATRASVTFTAREDSQWSRHEFFY